MTQRPTPERLEEIREQIGFDVSDYEMIGDLFAEIAALEKERDELRLSLTPLCKHESHEIIHRTGICAEVYAERDAWKEYAGKLREALQDTHYITNDLQPNSGHMYLSDINQIHKITVPALALPQPGVGG